MCWDAPRSTSPETLQGSAQSMGIRFALARHDDVMRALLALVVAFALLTEPTGALASGPKRHHKAKGAGSRGTHHARGKADHRGRTRHDRGKADHPRRT